MPTIYNDKCFIHEYEVLPLHNYNRFGVHSHSLLLAPWIMQMANPASPETQNAYWYLNLCHWFWKRPLCYYNTNGTSFMHLRCTVLLLLLFPMLHSWKLIQYFILIECYQGGFAYRLWWAKSTFSGRRILKLFMRATGNFTFSNVF